MNRKVLPAWLARLWAGRVSSVAQFLSLLRGERLERAGMTGDDVARRVLHGPPEEGKFWKVPERLGRGQQYFYEEIYLRQSLRANWSGCDPQIMLFASGLVLEARKAGVPLFVHTARRTPAEQRALFEMGRSNDPGPHAPHVVGAAVDIVHSAFAWQMSESEWQFIGKLGRDVAAKLRLQVDWGGEWEFYDPAHWQLSAWANFDLPPEDGLPPIHETPSKIWNRLHPR